MVLAGRDGFVTVHPNALVTPNHQSYLRQILEDFLDNSWKTLERLSEDFLGNFANEDNTNTEHQLNKAKSSENYKSSMRKTYRRLLRLARNIIKHQCLRLLGKSTWRILQKKSSLSLPEVFSMSQRRLLEKIKKSSPKSQISDQLRSNLKVTCLSENTSKEFFSGNFEFFCLQRKVRILLGKSSI
ncbi:hypothetical protein YC2023_050111 [Brassica napus]